MFTTRRRDGRLVSRPMAIQTHAEGSDLWFVTDIESNKLDELRFDPQSTSPTTRTRRGSGCR
jgi:general stress protein 26